MTAIRELLPQILEWQPGEQAAVLPQLPARPGVWMLLAPGELPVLAGTSQNTRASVTGRLAGPDPAQRSKKTDLSTTVTSCRYVVTYGRFESDWLYGKLVHAVWPGDFWERVGFAPMWMLKASAVPAGADGATRIMRLEPTTWWPGEGDAIALGPLATRSDAQDLADILTDLFDLCRYWQILARAPHGTPCAYHEMGRSPAPCAGLIPMEQYNQTVRKAMALAGRDRAKVVREKGSEMRLAAARLQFEQAARLKSWLQRTDALNEPRFQYLADVQQFVGLAVSRFRTQARPFFFWAGAIEAGDAVKLSKVQEHVATWRQRLEAGPGVLVDEGTRQWQCGLVTTHLFRPERKDLGWFTLDEDIQGWLEGIESLRS